MARLRVYRACNSRQIALHQSDPGALDGHFRSCSHGDADVGLGERRCIVDPIARHRHDAAFGPELLDDAVFVLRQDIGLDLFDAKLAGDRLSGRLVVAGQHHDPNAVSPQAVEGGSASWT